MVGIRSLRISIFMFCSLHRTRSNLFRSFSIITDIKEQVRTIEKAVNAKESRFILRVLRGLASTRKRLNENVIRRLILFYYGPNTSEREILLGYAHSVSQARTLIVR
jgi:hypothetical protein